MICHRMRSLVKSCWVAILQTLGNFYMQIITAVIEKPMLLNIVESMLDNVKIFMIKTI